MDSQIPSEIRRCGLFVINVWQSFDAIDNLLRNFYL